MFPETPGPLKEKLAVWARALPGAATPTAKIVTAAMTARDRIMIRPVLHVEKVFGAAKGFSARLNLATHPHQIFQCYRFWSGRNAGNQDTVIALRHQIPGVERRLSGSSVEFGEVRFLSRN